MVWRDGRMMSSSPTPSVDSLSGASTLGSILEGGESFGGNGGGGFELSPGHGSSSSSTSSSIIFPQLNLMSNGVLGSLMNGYNNYSGDGSSPDHHLHQHYPISSLFDFTSSSSSSSSPPIPPSSSSSSSSSAVPYPSISMTTGNCGFCLDPTSSQKPTASGQLFCQDCIERNTSSSLDNTGIKMTYTSTLELLRSFETASSRLQNECVKTKNEIQAAFEFFRTALDERRNEVLKDLESLYTTRQVILSVVTQRIRETLKRMNQALEFSDRLLRDACPTQTALFRKLLETRLDAISSNLPEPSLAMAAAAAGELAFITNFSAIQSAVRNLGYIRSGPDSVPLSGTTGKSNSILPIARPVQTVTVPQQVNAFQFPTSTMMMELNLSPEASLHSESNNGALSPYNTQIDIDGRIHSYEKWSDGTEATAVFPPAQQVRDHGPNNFGCQRNETLVELNSKLISPTTFLKTLSTTVKRHKMIYHCKFGEFGTGEAQFTEPSGVAVNGHNQIVVADTNNHRIQIFDREGHFKFQFGECGKRDGQLLYPNRVSVVKSCGDIVVTERSPTHQVQIYSQYGQFMRKFGANILQHPRGVTVDYKGRIIVIECKVMRVIIFDPVGNVLHKFGCSKHLEFPNGVVVNEQDEIFISDNRAHCVKVFNYQGVYLRQIGCEGLTNYPIGVGINLNGEIVVADNHNNFNITIFTQEGELVSALESKVKHAQCFDVALLEDGSVVLASKDYRLYVYRYTQPCPL